MGVLYHLASHDAWNVALACGFYTPRALETDGYIVCAEAAQYPALAQALYANRTDLVLLFIDAHRLDNALRQVPIVCAGQPAVGLCGPLPVAAVFETVGYQPDPDGSFQPHHETRALAMRSDDTLDDVGSRALRAMDGFDRPWWIAGGWAIDLFLGRKTRPHADLEIALLAPDHPALATHLHGWDLRMVAPGAPFVPWDGTPLAPPYHQIWARHGTTPAATHDAFSADPTMLDFLIEDAHDGMWQYRRDHRITRPIAAFGDVCDGIPFVRPEIALLFKAKEPRFKDQRDVEQVLPYLDRHARAWLRAALTTLQGTHAWLERI